MPIFLVPTGQFTYAINVKKKAALLPKYQALKVYKWCGVKYPHALTLNTRWR
jgi:hypothetical protein